VHDDYETCNEEAQSADEGSVLSWYVRLAQLRCQLDVLLTGTYEELLQDSEEIYAYRRAAGSAVAVVLANFSEREVRYDAGLVEGLSLAVSTHESATSGVLAPLEAVVYASA
jgi:alpha-glucosidase